jgi:hypothetical protein
MDHWGYRTVVVVKRCRHRASGNWYRLKDLSPFVNDMRSSLRLADVPLLVSAPSVAVPGGAAMWLSSSMPQPILAII